MRFCIRLALIVNCRTMFHILSVKKKEKKAQHEGLGLALSFAWCVPTAAPNIAKPVLNHLLSFTWSSFHSSLHCPTSRFPGPRSWWLLQLSSLPFIRVSSAASLLATNNPHLGRISGLLHQQPPFTQDVIASLWRLPILLNTTRFGQSVLHHIHSRTSFGVYLSFEHVFFHPTQITLSFASASVSVVSFISFSPSITWRLGCLQPITPLFVYPVACSCCYPLSSSPTTSKKQIPISTFSQSLWSFIHCPHPNSLCV